MRKRNRRRGKKQKRNRKRGEDHESYIYGNPDFAVGTLEEIIKAGHEVVLVVSQPDKAVGRSRALKYTPVKECAVAHGIEVYQPAKIRAEESVEYLRQYNADIIIVEAFWTDHSKSDP